jgi:Tfp pilus assembly pilus retraction ATPase PilT
MQTMDQALMKLSKEGRITVEAAHEKASDKTLFPTKGAEEEVR